jgi:gas vesicle protein GvpL/GvpF
VTALVYVYAIVGEPPALALRGLEDAPVRWISEGNLTAVVSDVPEALYDEAALNAHIKDLAWLGPRAVAHQDVNERLAEAADASVPLAFGTVFRTDERVKDLLRTERARLRSQLDNVRGRGEWVLALHRVGDVDLSLHSEAVHALQAEIASASPGRAHLLKRRMAELERDEMRRLDSEAASATLDVLHGATVGVYAEPLPTDTVERPLMRASVLVERARESAFLDAVEAIRAQWPEPTYRVLLTGPWPAYRFGGL